MKNIYNYNSLAEYANSSRPETESSVSFDGSEPHADGVNIILPFKSCYCEIGDMPVFDKQELRKKILKTATYKASAFDSSRYALSRGLYFGNNKGLCEIVSVDANGNRKWAESCWFRVTGFDLTADGSLTFKTYYNWGAHNGNVVSWQAGATLASIAAAFNGLGLNASYFKAVVLTDGTGIGIWVDYPTTATVSSIFSITEQSGEVAVEYMNKYNDADVVWQYVTTSSLIAGRDAATNITRRCGYDQSYAGAHWDKFYQYYSGSGAASFVADNAADIMKKSTFDGLASSTVAAQLALYNKYEGNYNKYLMARMMNTEVLRAVNGQGYYSSNVEQTALLAAIMTQDYNRNIIPAFPAAYYAYNNGVATSGFITGFEAGNWGLANANQMGRIIPNVGYDSSKKTYFNRCIDKFSGSQFYGNGSYLWTCSEYSAYFAYLYVGYGGSLNFYTKSATSSCRRVAALNFED